MATKLSRPVTRAVVDRRGAPLVVTLETHGVRFREPRRRTSYLLPYGVGFVEAARLFADAERRRKAAEKKAKRAARGGGR
jgi:hypothetical protein